MTIKESKMEGKLWTMKWKVRDIIYPYENGSFAWYKKNRYALVLKVDNKGFPLQAKYFYNWEVVRLLEFLMEIGVVKWKRKQ